MTPYLVFHHGKSLWSRRFKHVSVLLYEDGVWSHIDFGRRGADFVATWRENEIHEILSIAMHYHTLVHVPVGSATHFFRPMTCVSFAKHMLGIPSRALRPDALFRDVLRIPGAETINASGHDQREQRTETSAQTG